MIVRSRHEGKRKVITVTMVIAILVGALIYTQCAYSASSHWVLVKEVKEVKNEEYI